MSSKFYFNLKTVNSISGGKTSAYIAVHYPADYEVFSLVCIDDVRCKPKDKLITDYVNKKLGEKYISEFGEFIATAEDDKTLYAMMDLEQLIGKEIIWVRGKSYDAIIDERYERVLCGIKKRLPSWARRFCTTEMKLEPIFYWWFNEIGEKCQMRIGFRFDEFGRLENFFNNSDPTNFKIPISCSTRGQRKQQHENFNWRFCSFPLIKAGITKEVVNDYWNKNGFVGGNLFEEKRHIEFPIISNCVGCFHKKVDTLSIMWNLHENKMNWFAEQEKKNMGTWLDSGLTYEKIGENRENWIPEMIKEHGAVCDSGGCHD